MENVPPTPVPDDVSRTIARRFVPRVLRGIAASSLFVVPAILLYAFATPPGEDGQWFSVLFVFLPLMLGGLPWSLLHQMLFEWDLGLSRRNVELLATLWLGISFLINGGLLAIVAPARILAIVCLSLSLMIIPFFPCR